MGGLCAHVCIRACPQASSLTSPVLKLEFNKAGVFGIHTHGYTRYLDASWCKGHAITLLWSRERFSVNDRV